MKVGEKIKLLRTQKGLSQNQLAKQAKISQAGLSAIENGTASPSLQTLTMVAEVLGVSTGELVDEKADMPTTGTISRQDFVILERAKEEMTQEEWESFLRIIKKYIPQ